MSIQQTNGSVEEKLSDKDVEDYLRQHSDFFENHTRLLMELKIPHANTGSAVSLIEHQVDVLRRQNAKLQKQLDELLQIARDNDRLNKNMFQLMLGLMSTKSLPEIFVLLNESLRRDFSADAICIRILGQPKSSKLEARKEFLKDASGIGQLFGRQLKEGKVICGRAKPEQKQFLFEDQAEKIGSLAFIPLRLEKSIGLLAIGSFDEKRFHSGMGTLFLNQLSKVISKTILRFLKTT